jgi:hypothetical protein
MLFANEPWQKRFERSCLATASVAAQLRYQRTSLDNV